eukprot:162149-Pelagomonas_calceolata.AAC.3
MSFGVKQTQDADQRIQPKQTQDTLILNNAKGIGCRSKDASQVDPGDSPGKEFPGKGCRGQGCSPSRPRRHI